MITTIGKFRNSTTSITILIETYIHEVIYIDYKGSDPTEKIRTMRPVIVRKNLKGAFIFQYDSTTK
jgi:hypothetical protein